MSRGSVVICNHATCKVKSKIDELHHRYSSLRCAPLTSPVQAAIAELTNVAQTGNGLAAGEFAGGDILLVGSVSPLDQVCMHGCTADSPSRPAAVMRLPCKRAVPEQMTQNIDHAAAVCAPTDVPQCVDLQLASG